MVFSEPKLNRDTKGDASPSFSYKFFYFYLIFSILHIIVSALMVFSTLNQFIDIKPIVLNLTLLVPMVIDVLLLILYRVSEKFKWELKSVAYDMNEHLIKLLKIR